MVDNGGYLSDTPIPDDLVDLTTACAMVDRSRSTIRNWLRGGKLEKYRADPGNERSKTLVSKAELLQLAGAGLEVDPPRPGASKAPATVPAEVATLQAELAAARAEASSARAEAAALRDALAALTKSMERTQEAGQEALTEARSRVADMQFVLQTARDDVDHSRAAVVRMQAELDTVRASQRVSWFRRLLTG